MSAIHAIGITAVAVVDDEEGSRTSMGWVLSDAELRAVPIVGPLQDLEDAFRKVTAESHGMVCDHHLNVRNYARFSGARLVSFATRNQFPAILCTRYTGSDIDVIRPLLPDIPSCCGLMRSTSRMKYIKRFVTARPSSTERCRPSARPGGRRS